MRFRSGQTDQTVNLAAQAFEGSIPSLTTIQGSGFFEIWAEVAQLARVSAFQAEGCGFETRLPLQFQKKQF